VAGSAVGVEDRVGLAQDSLGVEVNGLVVCLVAVGLVASLLQLGGIILALFLGQALDNGLVDFGKLGLALD
jgi:Flp pilus assembly pilin Flp